MKDDISKVMRPFKRTQFVSQLVPTWVGQGRGSWLDACAGRVCPSYQEIARQKNYGLTTCSYTPKEKVIRFVDLQKYQPRLGVYDLVTSTDTLEHIADYMEALRNLRRYCRYYMIMGIPRGGKNGHKKLNPADNEHHHEWRLNSVQLKMDLENTGWDVCGEYTTYSRPVNCIGHAYFCTPTREVQSG